MRTLLGIILGVILTVGAAYLYDSHNAIAASTTGGPVNAPRPLVNWDVVGHKWDRLNERVRAEWAHLTS